jgi:hypothetical protein
VAFSPVFESVSPHQLWESNVVVVSPAKVSYTSTESHSCPLIRPSAFWGMPTANSGSIISAEASCQCIPVAVKNPASPGADGKTSWGLPDGLGFVPETCSPELIFMMICELLMGCKSQNYVQRF